MAEPKDMIVPLLQDMRAEIAPEFDQVKQRLDKVGSGQRNIRAAISGETVLARVVVGEFEERLRALENDVKSLVKQK